MPFSQTLLPEFDEEMKNTRKDFGVCPRWKVRVPAAPQIDDLGPARGPRGGVAVVDHFHAGPRGFRNRVRFQARRIATRAELLSKFDQHVADARKAIAAASDADWAVIWTFKWDGKRSCQCPAQQSCVARS
jgi:hypothetical protein